jgi:drug/metabolite transporter (DMT)-like permease
MLRNLSSPGLGSLAAIGAVFCFSVNDVAIKFLSGDYALHQVVLIRSTIGLLFLLALIVPFAGGLRALKTRRLPMHLLRGLCVVFANMSFFLGLAALPLAEGVAIFFVSPLIITVFSVVFLHEKVGPFRWAAVAVGLIGVLVVLRPGTAAFQPASLLPIAAAFGYATLHMLTRHIGKTESSAALSFYIQLTFIIVTTIFGLVAGDGRFNPGTDPSLEFLLRAWSRPAPDDAIIFVLVGITSALGGFLISFAYRTSEAALVAPFEYVALPLSIVWGILVFADWPDAITYAGIALILVSGLVIIWREARSKGPRVPRTPRYRR